MRAAAFAACRDLNIFNVIHVWRGREKKVGERGKREEREREHAAVSSHRVSNEKITKAILTFGDPDTNRENEGEKRKD